MSGVGVAPPSDRTRRVFPGNPSQHAGLLHAALPEYIVASGGPFGACGGSDALPTRPVQVLSLAWGAGVGGVCVSVPCAILSPWRLTPRIHFPRSCPEMKGMHSLFSRRPAQHSDLGGR